MDKIKTISAESMSFDFAKDKICCMLVNKKQNENLLSKIPYRIFYDLAIIYYLCADGKTEIITNHIANSLGVDEATLYNLARHNTPILHRGVIWAWADVINGVTSDIPLKENTDAYDGFDFSRTAPDATLPMYAATNADNIYGAAVILYDGLLEAVAKRIGDFYVLPSSIHDVMFLPAEFCDAESLTRIVKDINATELPKKEVLSENIYHYSAENYNFKIIS